jgi:hypothetical protein
MNRAPTSPCSASRARLNLLIVASALAASTLACTPALAQANKAGVASQSAGAVLRIRLQSVGGQDSLTTPMLGEPGAKLVGTLARDPALTQVVRKDAVAPGSSWALGKLDVGAYFLEFQITEADGRSSRSAVYRLLLNENWRQTVYDIVSPAEPQ